MKVKKLVVNGPAEIAGDVITAGHFYGIGVAKSSKFNTTNGTTVIPHSFGAPDNYCAIITPNYCNGKVGEFAIEKGTDQVILRNTGDELNATCEVILLKIKPGV